MLQWRSGRALETGNIGQEQKEGPARGRTMAGPGNRAVGL